MVKIHFYHFILSKSFLQCLNVSYAIFFLSTPSNAVETIVPITSDTRYNHEPPTTGNTKIPPCGAISVQLNTMLSAPATPEPMIHEGIT